MPSVIPRFTDNIVVVAPTLLRVGGNLSVRGTLDLRLAYAAIIFIDIAKGGQTALRTKPVKVNIRRMLTLDTNENVIHPGGIVRTGTVGSYYITNVNGNVFPADTSIPVTSPNSFALGEHCAIWLPGQESTSFETVNIVRTDASRVYVDSPLQYPRTSTHFISTEVDSFPPFQISGGAIWEVIFDIGGETASADSIVRCMAQRYEGDMTV